MILWNGIFCFQNSIAIDKVSDFYKSMYHSESQGKNSRDKLYLRILMITDFISGMTDSYAKRMYQELFAQNGSLQANSPGRI